MRDRARLSRCGNIAELRRVAKRRLPLPVFDYLEGGADDERSLGRNVASFSDYDIIPDILVDVATITMSTTLFGRSVAWPLLLAPTGLTRLFDAGAETAVARAAAAQGLPYALSTMGTTSIEDFGRLTAGPKAFQIYVFRDRGLTKEFVARASDAALDALIVTVDTPVAGNRERDRGHGFTMPPRLTPRGMLSFAAHPAWSWRALTGSRFDLVNVSHRAAGVADRTISLFDYIAGQFDRGVTWADIEFLAAAWGGKLLIKGVLRPEDAKQAAEAGASGVMLSNHGGRQLDGAPAPIDQVASVADAVGGRLEIICDGGVRRGSDVVKALAMGATACSIGRPYLYGLAAGGEIGVARALSILKAEFERTLALAGVNDIAKLGARHVRRARSPSFSQRDDHRAGSG